jgi:cytochrome c
MNAIRTTLLAAGAFVVLVASARATTARAADGTPSGADLFASRCVACHALNPTRKPGPMLNGVYGRRAGTVPGYAYSAALKNANLTWNATTLDRWLTDPPAYIPGVNMAAKVDDPAQRVALIAYLKSISPKAASGQ